MDSGVSREVRMRGAMRDRTGTLSVSFASEWRNTTRRKISRRKKKNRTQAGQNWKLVVRLLLVVPRTVLSVWQEVWPIENLLAFVGAYQKWLLSPTCDERSIYAETEKRPQFGIKVF